MMAAALGVEETTDCWRCGSLRTRDLRLRARVKPAPARAKSWAELLGLLRGGSPRHTAGWRRTATSIHLKISKPVSTTTI